MKLRLTLLSAVVAGAWCAAPMAQTTGSDSTTAAPRIEGSPPPTVPSTTTTPSPTNTPNPNKAQNSDMRTQDGTVRESTDVSRGAPTAGGRAPIGPTNSPNPNKAQNSDMRTQGGPTLYLPPNSPTNSPNPNKAQNSDMRTEPASK
jgi:hypothetical protein